MKSMTEKEQQEFCENLNKIVKSGIKTIKELGVVFGRVARIVYGSEFCTSIHEVNERIEALKKKEVK